MDASRPPPQSRHAPPIPRDLRAQFVGVLGHIRQIIARQPDTTFNDIFLPLINELTPTGQYVYVPHPAPPRADSPLPEPEPDASPIGTPPSSDAAGGIVDLLLQCTDLLHPSGSSQSTIPETPDATAAPVKSEVAAEAGPAAAAVPSAGETEVSSDLLRIKTEMATNRDLQTGLSVHDESTQPFESVGSARQSLCTLRLPLSQAARDRLHQHRRLQRVVDQLTAELRKEICSRSDRSGDSRIASDAFLDELDAAAADPRTFGQHCLQLHPDVVPQLMRLQRLDNSEQRQRCDVKLRQFQAACGLDGADEERFRRLVTRYQRSLPTVPGKLYFLTEKASQLDRLLQVRTVPLPAEVARRWERCQAMPDAEALERSTNVRQLVEAELRRCDAEAGFDQVQRAIDLVWRDYVPLKSAWQLTILRDLRLLEEEEESVLDASWRQDVEVLLNISHQVIELDDDDDDDDEGDEVGVASAVDAGCNGNNDSGADIRCAADEDDRSRQNLLDNLMRPHYMLEPTVSPRAAAATAAPTKATEAPAAKSAFTSPPIMFISPSATGATAPPAAQSSSTTPEDQMLFEAETQPFELPSVRPRRARQPSNTRLLVLERFRSTTPAVAAPAPEKAAVSEKASPTEKVLRPEKVLAPAKAPAVVKTEAMTKESEEVRPSKSRKPRSAAASVPAEESRPPAKISAVSVEQAITATEVVRQCVVRIVPIEVHRAHSPTNQSKSIAAPAVNESRPPLPTSAEPIVAAALPAKKITTVGGEVKDCASHQSVEPSRALEVPSVSTVATTKTVSPKASSVRLLPVVSNEPNDRRPPVQPPTTAANPATAPIARTSPKKTDEVRRISALLSAMPPAYTERHLLLPLSVDRASRLRRHRALFDLEHRLGHMPKNVAVQTPEELAACTEFLDQLDQFSLTKNDLQLHPGIVSILNRLRNNTSSQRSLQRRFTAKISQLMDDCGVARTDGMQFRQMVLQHQQVLQQTPAELHYLAECGAQLQHLQQCRRGHLVAEHRERRIECLAMSSAAEFARRTNVRALLEAERIRARRRRAASDAAAAAEDTESADETIAIIFRDYVRLKLPWKCTLLQSLCVVAPRETVVALKPKLEPSTVKKVEQLIAIKAEPAESMESSWRCDVEIIECEPEPIIELDATQTATGGGIQSTQSLAECLVTPGLQTAANAAATGDGPSDVTRFLLGVAASPETSYHTMQTDTSQQRVDIVKREIVEAQRELPLSGQSSCGQPQLNSPISIADSETDSSQASALSAAPQPQPSPLSPSIADDRRLPPESPAAAAPARKVPTKRVRPAKSDDLDRTVILRHDFQPLQLMQQSNPLAATSSSSRSAAKPKKPRQQLPPGAQFAPEEAEEFHIEDASMIVSPSLSADSAAEAPASGESARARFLDVECSMLARMPLGTASQLEADVQRRQREAPIAEENTAQTEQSIQAKPKVNMPDARNRSPATRNLPRFLKLTPFTEAAFDLSSADEDDIDGDDNGDKQRAANNAHTNHSNHGRRPFRMRVRFGANTTWLHLDESAARILLQLPHDTHWRRVRALLFRQRHFVYNAADNWEDQQPMAVQHQPTTTSGPRKTLLERVIRLMFATRNLERAGLTVVEDWSTGRADVLRMADVVREQLRVEQQQQQCWQPEAAVDAFVFEGLRRLKAAKLYETK